MEAGDDHRKGFMTISMKVCAGPGIEPGISDSSVRRATDCATGLLVNLDWSVITNIIY